MILVFSLGMRGSAGPLPAPMELDDVDLPKSAQWGGLSALSVAADGGSALVLSDNGSFGTVQITRDAAGHILHAEIGPMTPLFTRNGKPPRKGEADSEGMSVTGAPCISFEGPARVVCYDHLGGTGVKQPVPEAWRHLPSNRALESLTRDPHGRLVTLPEIAMDGASFPVWRLEGDAWQVIFSVPRRGDYMISDATFGPDGRLYILERRFLGLAGFSSRIRRFAEDGSGEETLWQTDPGLHDNLEGISLWRDGKGLRATLVSDDNFLWALRTELVELRLPD